MTTQTAATPTVARQADVPASGRAASVVMGRTCSAAARKPSSTANRPPVSPPSGNASPNSCAPDSDFSGKPAGQAGEDVEQVRPIRDEIDPRVTALLAELAPHAVGA